MIAGSRPSVIALAIAALLHAGAIAALATAGFDQSAQPTEPDPMVVSLMPEEPPPPPPPPPPPQAPARAVPPAPAIRAAKPIAAKAPAPPALVANASTHESVAPAAPAAPAPVASASVAGPEPTHVAAVIDAGRSCRTPAYPPAARRNHQSGIVVLKFLIDEEGGVVDSLVADSSGFDSLDQAARDALTLCRFRPGTVDGKPERSWVAMRYVWQMN